MTRKTRRFIFYIFLLFFIVFALIIILYAQGYNFDWQKKSLVMTGAFYLKSYPKNAAIYIDNEYQGGTNKFIKRLSPKKYEIKVSKTDYYDWQKTLEIKSKLVTEAKNILLIRKKPILNIITDSKVKSLAFSLDEKKIVYLTDRATKEVDPIKQKVADPKEIPTYSKFALRLIDLTGETDEQIYPPSFFEKNGRGFTASLPDLNSLSEISWSSNNEKLLLFFSNNLYYIFFNLKDQSKIIDLNNLIKVLSNYKIYSISNPLFHPQNSNRIYFYSKNSLYFIELNDSSPDESLISSPIMSDIEAYTILGNEILYIKSPGGEFYKTNLDGSSFKKNFDVPFLKSEQITTIINDEMLIVDSVLYLFNSKTQTLEKIAKNIEGTNFSSDGKKLLWRTKNEIGIIWLEDCFDQPFRRKHETEIIMKTFEAINQALWYSGTNQHIIFVLGDEIKITELDGRDKRNTMNLISVKNPTVFYNKWNKKLYILSEEQLFEIYMND